MNKLYPKYPIEEDEYIEPEPETKLSGYKKLNKHLKDEIVKEEVKETLKKEKTDERTGSEVRTILSKSEYARFKRVCWDFNFSTTNLLRLAVLELLNSDKFKTTLEKD